MAVTVTFTPMQQRYKLVKSWKVVEECYADSFAKGQFWLGTLRGYESLESSRADKMEGRIDLVTSSFSCGVDGPRLDQQKALLAMGYSEPGMVHGPMQFHGNVTVWEHPDCYCFCMSHAPACPITPKRDQVVFEILDVAKVCTSLVLGHPDIITTGFCHDVIYRPLIVDPAIISPEDPTPWTKSPDFDWEQELRIILYTNREQPEQFLTAESKERARLVRRVA